MPKCFRVATVLAFVVAALSSASLGYPIDAPEVEAAVQTILRAARARKMPLGITTSADTVERRLGEGFNVVTVGFGDGGITPESARTLAIGRKASGR